MSDKCGNCDCSNKSQCVKKGNSYGLEMDETKRSFVETLALDVLTAENNGTCKCGPNCSCTTCTCVN